MDKRAFLDMSDRERIWRADVLDLCVKHSHDRMRKVKADYPEADEEFIEAVVNDYEHFSQEIQ
jgi:hypothetical protein